MIPILFLALPGLITIPAQREYFPKTMTIIVDPSFPREMLYVALRRHVADMLSPCPGYNTSGSWDEEMLDAFRRSRRQLADVILDELVDEEFVPAERHPAPSDYRSRVVVIDPFVFGRSDSEVEAVPDGFHFQVDLADYEISAAISRVSSGKRTSEYGVVIWDWLDARNRDKYCYFSYHY